MDEDDLASQPTPSGRRVGAVLCILSALGVLALYLAMTTESPAHDWFTGTKDPVTDWSCCGLDDCEEIDDTAVKAVAGGYIYLPTNEFIPAARVQQSRSFRFARCVQLWNGAHKGVQYRIGSTRCFFVPSGV